MVQTELTEFLEKRRDAGQPCGYSKALVNSKEVKGMKRSLILLWVLIAVAALTLQLPVANAGTVDFTYYNMGALSSAELNSTYLLAKGTVIVLYPNSTNVVVGSAAENLVKTNQVTTVVMAGVGSSSQGTAAFAKHVAKATGVAVAGIVTGLGDGSVYTEGPEGYFIGRSSNIAGTYYTEPASAKLAQLYYGGARPVKLVGHSKGNLDIANTLYKLNNEGNRSLYSGVRFITFGCGVYVPTGLGSFKQYLGSLDSLGISNTVSYTNLTWVVGRYHTTNPYYWATYMPVENYVR
jgi:hypothetical protein